eukprot:6369003-Alexandrium_andersonii.AAC.1
MPRRKCADGDVATASPLLHPGLHLVAIDDGGVPLRHEVQRAQRIFGAAVVPQLLVPGVLLLARPMQVVLGRARQRAALPTELLLERVRVE